jgi:hypothetical protein
MRGPSAEPFADAQRQRELDALLEEEARSTKVAASIFSLQSAAQDDDDFDAPGPVAPTLAPALDEVLHRAQQLRIQEAAAAPPLAPAPQPTTEEGEEQVVGKEEEKGEGQGLWEAAEAALNQLTDTYARGFGDVEVRPFFSSYWRYGRCIMAWKSVWPMALSLKKILWVWVSAFSGQGDAG